VPVSVESSKTVGEKVDEVDTWRRYDVAFGDMFHLSVGVTGTFVESFAGETSVGTGGGPATVENDRVVEYSDVPAPFLAFTRQKYVAPVDKPGTDFDVSVSVESL
jgi:hypothetical protein